MPRINWCRKRTYCRCESNLKFFFSLCLRVAVGFDVKFSVVAVPLFSVTSFSPRILEIKTEELSADHVVFASLLTCWRADEEMLVDWFCWIANRLFTWFLDGFWSPMMIWSNRHTKYRQTQKILKSIKKKSEKQSRWLTAKRACTQHDSRNCTEIVSIN